MKGDATKQDLTVEHPATERPEGKTSSVSMWKYAMGASLLIALINAYDFIHPSGLNRFVFIVPKAIIVAYVIHYLFNHKQNRPISPKERSRLLYLVLIAGSVIILASTIFTVDATGKFWPAFFLFLDLLVYLLIMKITLARLEQ